MNVKIDDASSFKSIIEEIEKIPKLAAEQEKQALQEIKKIIVNNVKKAVPSQAEDKLSNYDGTTPYVHIKDDIKATVKQTKDGFSSVTIRGGKYTGYKWHMLDDGTRNPDGTIHTAATNFTINAMRASEQEIDRVIDALMENVANGR